MTKYWSNETLAHIERWPDAGLVHEGLCLFAELPRTEPIEFLLATDLHAGNVLRTEREPWLVIAQSPSSEIPPTTRRSTCSIVLRDCSRTRTARSAPLRTCLASITNESGCGCLLAQLRSRGTIGATANWWHSLAQSVRKLHASARPLHRGEG